MAFCFSFRIPKLLRLFCFCFGPNSRWWRSIIYNSWWYKPSTDIVWEREKSNMLPLQNVVSNASNLVTVVAWIIRYVSAIQASDTYLLRTTVDILLSSQSISRWRSTLFFFHTFFDFFVWKWSSTSSPRNIVSQKSLCIYTLKKKQRKCVSLFTPFVWNYLENIIYSALKRLYETIRNDTSRTDVFLSWWPGRRAVSGHIHDAV